MFCEPLYSKSSQMIIFSARHTEKLLTIIIAPTGDGGQEGGGSLELLLLLLDAGVYELEL